MAIEPILGAYRETTPNGEDRILYWVTAPDGTQLSGYDADGRENVLGRLSAIMRDLDERSIRRRMEFVEEFFLVGPNDNVTEITWVNGQFFGSISDGQKELASLTDEDDFLATLRSASSPLGPK